MPVVLTSTLSAHSLITATLTGVRAVRISALNTIADSKNRTTDQAVRCRGGSPSKVSAAALDSIFDLATSRLNQLHPSVADIYGIDSGLADCLVTEQLVQKFGTSTASRAIISSDTLV